MIIYNVIEVTRRLKDLLESDQTLQDLWVAGEISNFKPAPSGHLYFTVKDAESQLSCVMWRSQAMRLPALPRDGQRVIVHGHITIYEARGAYQLYADLVQAEGIGVLAARFEELKARLTAEGLFDPAHKRPLPPLPRRIGLVTSPTGAVLHDILHVLRRRYPLAEVIIAPSAVQGVEAPPQIVAALIALQAVGDVDVIIVARGGGSLEDLWAFNEEVVARAIYACTVPVISAVGHEVDFTISDFVADVRAPTPSAAAELVAPALATLATQIAAYQRQMLDALQEQLQGARASLGSEQRALQRVSPHLLLDQQRQRIDDFWQRGRAIVGHRFALKRERVRGLASHMRALSPESVLGRGFAIVWLNDGNVITSVRQAQAGERLRVQVRDGRFGVVVEGESRRKRGGQAPDDDGQLTLGLA